MLYNVVLVSAVAILQSFTLLDPVDCSMPGRSGLHHLLEFAQTQVHRVSDAIPPSHHVIPFSSCPQSFQHQGLFQRVSSLHEWPKYWSLSFSIGPSNECSGLISFRIDWFDLLAVQGTLKSSLGPQLKSINYSVLFMSSLCLILTPIHDYWKDHIFDSIDLCWQSDLSAF